MGGSRRFESFVRRGSGVLVISKCKSELEYGFIYGGMGTVTDWLRPSLRRLALYLTVTKRSEAF